MPENNEPKSWFAEKIWDTVSGFFVAMFKSVWSGWEDIIADIGRRGWKVVLELFSHAEDDMWDGMLDYWISAGTIDKEAAAEIKKLKNITSPVDFLAYLMVIINLLKTTNETTMYGTTANLRHNIAAKYHPEIPGPHEIIQASFIAPEKTQEVRDAMKKLGFSDEHIDLMFLANYRLYSEEIVRVLWLRGVLDNDHMFMRMRELGYTDTRTEEIMQSWSIIPGPSDLFHLVAREAFEPDAIKLMGLGDEFPVDQVEWLKKQGISEEWAKKYWYAHWDQPSIMQGYEMLHRGVIGLDALNMLFKTVEIPPFWRDKLTEIAYMPYTRVDVRRMHKTGVLTDADLLKAYMDVGYDLEHATKMAEFTKLHNLGAEKDLSKGEILKGYREGILSNTETESYLTDLGYSKDEAEYYITLEDYKEAKSFQNDKIKIIESQYKKNVIDAFEARRQLDFLDLPAKETNLLMERWKVKRISNTKMPSKEDLTKFFGAGIINEDIFVEEMQKLGYPEKYVAWYLQLLIGQGED